MRNYNKYIIEFIGTFFLVLTIALTGNPIAIGAVLVAMVYMGGYISGALYNPALTLALFIRRKMEVREALIYALTQIIAGAVAALVYHEIAGKTFIPKLGENVPFHAALLLEVLFTFALATVVLHVATSKKTAANQYFGLAIGLTVMAGAFASGPLSGGVLNPAVAVGPILLDYQNWNQNFLTLLIYISGPLMGGLLAGILYNYLEEK